MVSYIDVFFRYTKIQRRGSSEDRAAGPAQLGDLDLERGNHRGPRARSCAGTDRLDQLYGAFLVAGDRGNAHCRAAPGARCDAGRHCGTRAGAQRAGIAHDLAAAPEALQGAVAAGILGCGSVVLGSSEAAGICSAAIAKRASIRANRITDAAQAIVREYRSAQRSIPGYGHPLHKQTGSARPTAVRNREPRPAVRGRHVQIAREVESLLPDLVGKRLALNVSGAIPAVLLDAGYPLAALKGIPILARTAGLIAHLLEEQQHGHRFRHVARRRTGDRLRRRSLPPGFEASKDT